MLTCRAQPGSDQRRAEVGVLLAELAEIVMGNFVDNKAERYIHYYADRLRQMRAKYIADYIG